MKLSQYFRSPAFFAFIFAFQFNAGVNALFCYRCLSLDCQSGLECRDLENFIKSELRPYYHFQGDKERCPTLEQNTTWRFLQSDTEPCPEEPGNEGTCVTGRMRIKTGTRVYHATILGCAKSHLLKRIQKAHQTTGQCDLAIHGNLQGRGVEMELEHCRDVSRECYHDDFCVDWTQSKVTKWPKEKDPKSEGVSFFENVPENRVYWLGGIVAGAVLLFGAMICKMFWCQSVSPEEMNDCEKLKDNVTLTSVKPEETPQVPEIVPGSSNVKCDCEKSKNNERDIFEEGNR